MSGAIASKLESIISGHKVNADDADWLRAALSQPAPSPQPAVPVVSDEQIDAATRHMYHNGRPTSKEYRVGIVRAILAHQPTKEAEKP